MLRVAGARKRFADTVALDGAELELQRGEWLGLLGPNGAGKTTLVRAIAGRVRLEGGTIELGGVMLDRGSEATRARRSLGVVPQTIALYPALSARENLEVFGALVDLRGTALRERVEWALAFTGLAERAKEPIRGFSGGMQRRLNIACGVLHKPEVVLLDEPTVGVDPQSRARFWEMLRELQQQGTALLLTTHQLDEAQQLCERIVVIDHGRTIAAGTFAQLVERTLGRARHVAITLRNATALALGADVEIDGNRLHTRMDEVAVALPVLLAQLREGGAEIEDLRVEAPTLQAVFLALTGRELRE